MSKPVQIFLCHASEDKPKVIEVYRFLKQQGFKPWLDKEDLLPGQRWDQEIPKALKASDFILIFLSQNSVSKRGYVQREFKLALDVLEEIPEGQIFVIPVRLDTCTIPDRFHHLHYCDLFDGDGLDKVIRAIRAGLQSAHQGLVSAPAVRISSTQSQATLPYVSLRTSPITGLSHEITQEMILKYDFVDVKLNRMGKGLQHQYEIVERNGEKLVVDHKTRLIWQHSGSSDYMICADVKKYVRKLNSQKFAGLSGWRLPTLEEMMSLMEPTKTKNGLYVNPVFDNKQRWLWTADKDMSGKAWAVYFDFGYCLCNSLSFNHSVRVVRSGQSII